MPEIIGKHTDPRAEVISIDDHQARLHESCCRLATLCTLHEQSEEPILRMQDDIAKGFHTNVGDCELVLAEQLREAEAIADMERGSFMLTFEDASEQFGGAGDMDLDNPGEVHSADTDDTAETMETHVFGEHGRRYDSYVLANEGSSHCADWLYSGDAQWLTTETQSSVSCLCSRVQVHLIELCKCIPFPTLMACTESCTMETQSSRLTLDNDDTAELRCSRILCTEEATAESAGVIFPTHPHSDNPPRAFGDTLLGSMDVLDSHYWIATAAGKTRADDLLTRRDSGHATGRLHDPEECKAHLRDATIGLRHDLRSQISLCSASITSEEPEDDKDELLEARQLADDHCTGDQWTGSAIATTMHSCKLSILFGQTQSGLKDTVSSSTTIDFKDDNVLTKFHIGIKCIKVLEDAGRTSWEFANAYVTG